MQNLATSVPAIASTRRHYHTYIFDNVLNVYGRKSKRVAGAVRRMQGFVFILRSNSKINKKERLNNE